MIFLDSSFLISVYCEVEENHAKSMEVLVGIAKTGETLVLTDHVLGEVVTLIKSRYGSQKAFEAGTKIFSKQRVEMLLPSREEVEQALNLVLKYEKFSFCDALSIAVMDGKGIRKIASFDSDFDAIKTIERIQ